jgi:hypothetical protein
LPSLVIELSTIDENQISQTGWEERSNFLMQKAFTIFGGVKEWLAVEAEPLFLSWASSQRVIQEHHSYPDIMAGVLDCVAHRALLTIDKILRFLLNAKLQSSSLAGNNSQLLDDPDVIERWRYRAIKAFKFVQEESILAAKPLDFGLRQLQIA